ncbi:hypothetical protein CBR_g12807 [Chara braunii]|uniref:Endonuclease/exonuclease/phosphatase domain-containing protein n=1 Tax=Chara braunii TaxID=69332 RepID=A0A388KSP8_CHABU|nr:hypothetical protein CBR_g12807 [Chara braunii]|eukprot:GBG73091.1 hypothetical protein CBR_g12807 [Chara braunii]
MDVEKRAKSRGGGYGGRYVVPTVELRGWLINEQRVEEVQLAGLEEDREEDESHKGELDSKKEQEEDQQSGQQEEVSGTEPVHAVEEEHDSRRQQSKQQEATSGDESVQGRGGAEENQHQEGQQQNLLSELARQEQAETGLKAILREGECYICPIVFWRTVQGIQMLMDGVTEVPIFSVNKLPVEQCVLSNETKLSEQKTATPTLWWTGHQVWAPAQGTKGGVCIFVSPHFRGEVKDKYHDSRGRWTWLVLQWGEEVWGVVTVYGPKEIGARQRLWERLPTLVPDVEKTIITGDYNSITDPLLDAASTRNLDAGLLTLLNSMISLGCTDAYRTLYPQDKSCTFWGNTTSRRSKIDMIWATSALNDTLEQIQTSPVVVSGHYAVIVTYPVGKLEMGHPEMGVQKRRVQAAGRTILGALSTVVPTRRTAGTCGYGDPRLAGNIVKAPVLQLLSPPANG